MCPDPLLVGFRAAINWSQFAKQQLLPACGVPKEHLLIEGLKNDIIVVGPKDNATVVSDLSSSS
jgi:hypothetical protein